MLERKIVLSRYLQPNAVVSVSTQSPCAGCVVSTVHYLLYTIYTIYRGGLGHSDPRVSRELAHMERGGTLARVTIVTS